MAFDVPQCKTLDRSDRLVDLLLLVAEVFELLK
jgi:hypothetical protein